MLIENVEVHVRSISEIHTQNESKEEESKPRPDQESYKK